MNDSNHGRVVRIFVCLSRGLYCHRKLNRAIEQWWPTARQKCSYLYHQGEFQHNYFDFVSLHHSDHDGVVRIFVGHSEVVKRLLHYAAQFFPYQECNVIFFSADACMFELIFAITEQDKLTPVYGIIGRPNSTLFWMDTKPAIPFFR